MISHVARLVCFMMALGATANAHGVLTLVKGANGVTSSGFGVLASTPRDGTRANPFQQDSSIIRDNEISSGTADFCGRTRAGGNNDVVTQLATASSAGLPSAAADGSVTMTLHQVNGDGAGPYTCEVSDDATGQNFVAMTVTTNVPGRNSRSNARAQDFALVAQMPAGTSCSGGPNGDACIVRCRNAARAGPFGGCVAVTGPDAAAPAKSTGTGASTAAGATAGTAAGATTGTAAGATTGTAAGAAKAGSAGATTGTAAGAAKAGSAGATTGTATGATTGTAAGAAKGASAGTTAGTTTTGTTTGSGKAAAASGSSATAAGTTKDAAASGTAATTGTAETEEAAVAVSPAALTVARKLARVSRIARSEEDQVQALAAALEEQWQEESAMRRRSIEQDQLIAEAEEVEADEDDDEEVVASKRVVVPEQKKRWIKSRVVGRSRAYKWI